MQFYLFSLSACLIDFIYCQFFKRWARYDLKESLVTLLFYASDIWSVLFIRSYKNELGAAARDLWKIKYGFLNSFDRFFKLIYENVEPFFSTQILYYLVLFLAVDFTYYWIHRASHEFELLWSQHAVHHSTTRFNFLATQRNSLRFFTINAQLLFFAIPMVLMFPLVDIVFMYAIIQCHQTLIHSEWIPRFPRKIELIFNTPWHHRIHHSIEGTNQSGNYGAVFIIYDRIFGTVIEVPDKNFKYGIEGYKHTNNPIKLNFQYTINFLQKVFTSGSLSKSLVILLLPTSTHKYFNVN